MHDSSHRRLHRPALHRLVLLLAVSVGSGCSSTPAPPAPGTSQVYGQLELVPRVKATGGGGSYGDRRLRDIELVDYSKPGFAVVYVEEENAPGGEVLVTIRSSRLGVALDPAHVAVGASGRVLVRNDSAEPHVVSHPAAGALVEVASGEQVELRIPRAGEQRLYLLDAPATSVTLFAAPGPFAVAAPSGLFTLGDLAPGSRTVHAWHPRFPPASRSLDLAADASVRVDFRLGVGLAEEAEDAH